MIGFIYYKALEAPSFRVSQKSSAGNSMAAYSCRREYACGSISPARIALAVSQSTSVPEPFNQNRRAGAHGTPKVLVATLGIVQGEHKNPGASPPGERGKPVANPWNAGSFNPGSEPKIRLKHPLFYAL